MSSLIINCGIDDWFTIMFDNKPAGEIRISTTFAPEGGDEFENMKQKYEEQQEILAKEAEEAKAQVEEMLKVQEELDAQLAAQNELIEKEREEAQEKLRQAQEEGELQAAELEELK